VAAIVAISTVLLALLASAFGSDVVTSPGGGLFGDPPGSRIVVLFTVMLVVGGAFVVLRAAISHDQFSRRLDSLRQELESSNARLKEFSFKDEMTGLYNRRFFELRLEDEVSRYCRFNHSLAVVMIDIDGFKSINEELGHAAGDETLRAVGALLVRHSRNLDVIARYGGDEFAVVLVETPKQSALVYAERIRRQIESAELGHGRPVTVSLGVACLPEDVGPVPEDIVTTAQWALEEAKRAGRNTVGEREGLVGKRRGGGAHRDRRPDADARRHRLPQVRAERRSRCRDHRADGPG
jgi:diguanylate cyclase (GGDEF)-like protein